MMKQMIFQISANDKKKMLLTVFYCYFKLHLKEELFYLIIKITSFK